MLVPINKVIECSTVDGPGNRTTVFVQQCNIRCLYCHNPETQNMCINCKECVSICPSGALEVVGQKVICNRDKCILCDSCIKVCKHNASPRIEYLSATEVYSRIKKNIPFIRGITISGGECSLYISFIEELFSLAKNDGLGCLLDSNGMVDFSLHPKLMEYCDGVMLDIKSWDDSVYFKLTGSHNNVVKRNLKYLDSISKIEELRIVVVDDYVDSYACLDGIKSTIDSKNVSTIKIKLIRFRNNGVKGILSTYKTPSIENMQKLKAYANSLGFNDVVIR